MPARDFVAERRKVWIAGRRSWWRRILRLPAPRLRFEVRAPTLATMDLAFEEILPFAADVLATARRHPELCAPEMAVSMALERTPRAGLARVLSTCVEGLGDPEDWPLQELGERVAAMVDLARVVAHYSRKHEGSAGSWDRSLLNLAKHAGCSVLELMNEWPYEAFLSLCDALEDETCERDAQTAGVSPEFYRLMCEGAAARKAKA